MNRRNNERIIHEFLSLPTAPFSEHLVVQYIRDFVADRPKLSLKEDAVGNMRVQYRSGGTRIARPVCFAAHLDHPGFVASETLDSRRIRAHWRGGVLPAFFPNAKVRFFSGGEWIRGKVSRTQTAKRRGREVVVSAEIAFSRNVEIASGSPGMWDFPDPVIKRGKLHARACDDLAGAAAMLACMHELDAKKPSGEAYFLFTRAEEVGFIGAMAACKLGTIPKKCIIIAVENSSELANARMGDGPILRVGDKQTTFTSTVTNFCGIVADAVAKKHKTFLYQRRLMDGGTCESSAYCALGYDATGICLALGNYHNMNKKTGKLAPEYIHMDDYHRLVRWFIALCETPHRFTGKDARLDALLKELQKEHNPLLRRTVRKPA